MTDPFAPDPRRERIARAIVIEPNGMSEQQATDIQTRLTAVEGLAATINPLEPQPDQLIGTRTHGLSGTETSAPIEPEQVMWTPIWVGGGFTALSMGLYVSAAQTGAMLRLGLYDRNGVLTFTYGEVPAGTTGWKFAAPDPAGSVAAGATWLAVHCNNVAGVQLLMMDQGRALFHLQSDMGTVRSYIATRPYGTLPATMELDWFSAYAPLLALRVPQA